MVLPHVKDRFTKITDMKSLCEIFKGQTIPIYMPGGNKGDGLIYFGAKNLFKQYDIIPNEIVNLPNWYRSLLNKQNKENNRFQQTITQNKKFIRGIRIKPKDAKNKKNPNINHNNLLRKDLLPKALFVYGCGGYCNIHHSMPERLAYFLNKFDEIYILPSSFECSYQIVGDFISNLPDHIMVFCREKYSYQQVKNKTRFPENVRIDHDTALFGNYDSFITENSSGKIISLRQDLEKNRDWNLGNNVVDLSAGGNHTNFMNLLNEIKKYKIVVTDRAHVSIVATMLKKEVHILPNNYHKVKGIYEYSLKDKPNIHFYENVDEINNLIKSLI